MLLQSDQKAIVHIVDDDSSIREALQDLCRSIGIETRGYATAQDFFATTVADSPGCLIIDIRLPDMNGLDLQGQLTRAGVRLPMWIRVCGCCDHTRGRRWEPEIGAHASLVPFCSPKKQWLEFCCER